MVITWLLPEFALTSVIVPVASGTPRRSNEQMLAGQVVVIVMSGGREAYLNVMPPCPRDTTMRRG